MVVWVPGSMARTFSNRLAGPSQGEGFSSFPFFFFPLLFFESLMNILPTGGHGYPDRCRLLVAWMSFNGSHSILLKRTFGQLQLHDNLGSFRANWGV